MPQLGRGLALASVADTSSFCPSSRRTYALPLYTQVSVRHPLPPTDVACEWHPRDRMCSFIARPESGPLALSSRSVVTSLCPCPSALALLPAWPSVSRRVCSASLAMSPTASEKPTKRTRTPARCRDPPWDPPAKRARPYSIRSSAHLTLSAKKHAQAALVHKTPDQPDPTLAPALPALSGTLLDTLAAELSHSCFAGTSAFPWLFVRATYDAKAGTITPALVNSNVLPGDLVRCPAAVFVGAPRPRCHLSLTCAGMSSTMAQ